MYNINNKEIRSNLKRKRNEETTIIRSLFNCKAKLKSEDVIKEIELLIKIYIVHSVRAYKTNESNK